MLNRCPRGSLMKIKDPLTTAMASAASARAIRITRELFVVVVMMGAVGVADTPRCERAAPIGELVLTFE